MSYLKNASLNTENITVLGIDPGLAITGYAILETDEERYGLLEYGCIQTPSQQETAKRLLTIYRSVCSLIDSFTPSIVAVEQLFFCKNVRTAMQVGEARGAVLTAAAMQKVPIAEYTPLQVKQVVAGYGKADKRQVQKMVALILKLQELPEPDDASDALAIALCHLQLQRWHLIVEKGAKKKF